MSYETGTRGRLLADRLRIVGAEPTPGRPVAAVDRHAPPATAAVRVALVDPSLDPQTREEWAAAWRSLAERRLVPPLIDLVEDEELGSLAIIAMGTSQPVAPGSPAAADQAERLGAALAGAGLDLGDLRLDDLGLDEEGRLQLDTVRFPAATPPTPAEGAALVLGLIGPVVVSDAPRPASAARVRPVERARGRRRRLLVPATVALLLAAGVITILPDRSSAPASIAPAPEDQRIDDAVVRALEATARPQREPVRRERPDRSTRERPSATSTPEPVAIVVERVAPPPAVEADPDALPVAAASAANGAALSPVDAGGALRPIDAEGLPALSDDDLPPLAGDDTADAGVLDPSGGDGPVEPAVDSAP